MSGEDGRMVLVFDDRCRLCSKAADSVRRRDRAARIRLVPASALADDPAVAPGLTPEAARREVHLFAPGAKVRKGVEVVAPIAGALPRWRWLAPLLRRFPFSHLVAAAWLLLKQLRHEI